MLMHKLKGKYTKIKMKCLLISLFFMMNIMGKIEF